MRAVFATGRAAAACLSLFAGSVTAAAGEVPQAVKDACSGDYKQHCSMHAPESDAARDCMADVFGKLSDGCVSAILNSDLVEEQADPAKDEAQVAVAPQPERKPAVKPRKVKRKARVARVHHQRTKRHRRLAKPKKVVRYVKRGIRTAKFYVSRAFRKAFH